MNLTDEQREIGKDNMNRVVGTTRRDFLKDAVGGLAAGGGGLGAAYYQYDTKLEKRLRVGIIGTGDEGNVLIGALNPDFIEVVAIADPRPYSQHRAFYGDWYSARGKEARPGLCKVYGWKDREEGEKNVKVYSDYEELLANKDVEAVIIALPLFLHDIAAIKAMRAGKHVLTEKLMGKTVHQCKEMARVAKQTGLLLATGHQRHYSVLYDNAVDTIRRGVIGDLHHIRAQWHRGSDSWRPPLPLGTPLEEVKNMIRAARKNPDNAKAKADEARIKAEHKLVLELESWERVASGKHPKYPNLKPAQLDEWARKVAQKRAQVEDEIVDATQYGYADGKGGDDHSYTAQEEMIRWRLWNRTGAGLMAELGSHQLDASGIFISSQFKKGTKVQPLSVVAMGHKALFPGNRDVDDHVYCTFEYPGKGYYEDDDPSKAVANDKKKVGVFYSSINSNGFGGYGEVVYGNKGTMILEKEAETMLFKSGAPTSVALGKGDDLVDSSESGGPAAAIAAAVTEKPSRGYREEIEHWAWCIKNDQPAETLHCHPKIALADAVIALTSNIAIADNRRIEFDKDWFEPESDATPEGIAPRKASEITT